MLVDAIGGATGVAGQVVLDVAVWGAVVAYVLQMTSFIVLRRRFPRAVRPYRSPTGNAGAVVAGVIALAMGASVLRWPIIMLFRRLRGRMAGRGGSPAE